MNICARVRRASRPQTAVEGEPHGTIRPDKRTGSRHQAPMTLREEGDYNKNNNMIKKNQQI